ncbi:MAG: type 4 fimbrial biosynthesis protein [Betaproteobacteria bacterium]|nr:type 4 fimbrial biosynthesis protein [Betaproteobacteria bacterium]
MIEVLVTIVILVIGMLGLAGLKSRAHVTEMESYQRAQALSLLRDMEARLRAGRNLLADTTVGGANSLGFNNLASTDGSVVWGTGDTNSDCSGKALAEYEVCLWSQALKGAAESLASGNVGAMLGARGCLISQVPNASAIADFYVVVVWQGLIATTDPVAGTPGALCASGVNFGTGLRRAVATRVLIPKLN